MLTPEQLLAREGKITGSFLPALVSGDEAKIFNKWLELVGDPSWQPEDLSNVWAPAFGSYIESFALDWHALKTGTQLGRRGEVVVHPTRPYVCVTLDAYRSEDSTVIDCKAPGAYRKLDNVLSYYVPQMVAQRACVGAERASLLVVHGGAEPQEYPITWDDAYEQRLWEIVDQYWHCITTLTPPNGLGALAAPVKAERVYEMQGNNEWASEAVIWLETYRHAKQASTSEKALKAMVPADAKRVFGHSVEIIRDKAGRLSLREQKS